MAFANTSSGISTQSAPTLPVSLAIDDTLSNLRTSTYSLCSVILISGRLGRFLKDGVLRPDEESVVVELQIMFEEREALPRESVDAVRSSPANVPFCLTSSVLA